MTKSMLCYNKESLFPISVDFTLVLGPQKDGQTRPVIDFAKVNEVTEADRYSLPVLSDLRMSLGRGKKLNRNFSSLLLFNGYWQVPLAQRAREVTAYSTLLHILTGCVCRFGLNSALITFRKRLDISSQTHLIQESMFIRMFC